MVRMPNSMPASSGRRSRLISPPISSAAKKKPFCPKNRLTATAGATATNRRCLRSTPPADAASRKAAKPMADHAANATMYGIRPNGQMNNAMCGGYDQK